VHTVVNMINAALGVTNVGVTNVITSTSVPSGTFVHSSTTDAYLSRSCRKQATAAAEGGTHAQLIAVMTSSSSSDRCWAQHTARPAALLLLWSLALYGPLLPLASAAIPFQQHPVDWTLVPAKPEAAANLTTSCICALLNGTCTPGCCCDSACPADLVQSFKAKGQCLPEGTPPQQLPYCVPAEPFAKVGWGLRSATEQSELWV
jgi:hypothetical protein